MACTVAYVRALVIQLSLQMPSDTTRGVIYSDQSSGQSELTLSIIFQLILILGWAEEAGGNTQ